MLSRGKDLTDYATGFRPDVAPLRSPTRLNRTVRIFWTKGFIEVSYYIEYSPDTEDHLRSLTARQRAIVLDTVEKQLAYQPTVETRNRKQMRSNPLAPRELRIGNLRVYYDVEEEPEPVVKIRAVGIKDRNYI